MAKANNKLIISIEAESSAVVAKVQISARFQLRACEDFHNGDRVINNAKSS